MEREDILGLEADRILEDTNPILRDLSRKFMKNPEELGDDDTSMIDPEDGLNLDDFANSDDDEINLDDSRSRKKKKRSKGDRMPENIRNLIGEANTHFALKNIHKCIDICKEVIRVYPMAREPYSILGAIFEESGQPNEALQFLIFAAILSKKEGDERNDAWKRLAIMSSNNQNWEQANYCWTKMVRMNKEGSVEWSEALFHRSCMYRDQLDNTKKAIEGFETILKYFPSSPEVLTILTHIYWENKQFTELINILCKYLERVIVPDKSLVYLLVQAYLGTGAYQKMIATIKLVMDEDEQLPIEFHIKYAEGYLLQGDMENAERVTSKIPPWDPEKTEYFEDYISLVETYIQLCEWEHALPILESFNMDDARVLGLIGKCHYWIGDDDELTIDCFEKSLNEIPDREIKSYLVDLLKQQNTQRALELVGDDDEIALRFDKASLLVSNDDFDGALEIYMPFVDNFVHFQTRKKKVSAQLDDHSKLVETATELKLFGLITNVVKILLQPSLKRYEDAVKILECCRHCHRIFDADQLKILHRWNINCTNLLGNYEDTCHALRDLLIDDDGLNIREWNMLNDLAWKSADPSLHQKWMVRIQEKKPEFIPINWIVANASTIRKSYRLALALYLNIWKGRKQPTPESDEDDEQSRSQSETFDWHQSYEPRKDRLLALCIGINYLNVSMGRLCPNRNNMIASGFAFLNHYYRIASLTSDTVTEANYNLARAFHHLGLDHYAIFYYEKVIPYQEYRREAAYNLSCIYRKTGNLAMAKKIISENIVI